MLCILSDCGREQHAQMFFAFADEHPDIHGLFGRMRETHVTDPVHDNSSLMSFLLIYA